MELFPLSKFPFSLALDQGCCNRFLKEIQEAVRVAASLTSEYGS